ncbi:MAG: VWA domain-containing protein [Labilithrix sp.]|nr:VWA domain-containing protein [Labilithrix sp.]
MTVRSSVLTLASFACVLSQACSRGDFPDTSDPLAPGSGSPGETFTPDAADPSGDGPSCATATMPVTRAAIYMQIILDGSGSMMDPVAPAGPTGLKWKAASDALESFFDDARAKKDAAFAVGLFLFDGTKGVLDFEVPDVPIRHVDNAHHAALRSRIKLSTPQGGTPIKRALEGQIPILQGFVPLAPLKPNGKRVLVVITDGVPDGPADVQPTVQAQCAKLVEDAFAATPSITTFAVGVGDPASDASTYNEMFVGRLATVGGAAAPGCSPGWNESSPPGSTPCHFQVTPGAKTAAQLRDELLAAINAIRGAATSCELALERADGTTGVVDPSRVNVVFTDGEGKQTKVPQNASDGWTYDDPSDPRAVVFHGPACDRLKAESDGKVEIELGCKTLVK